MKYLKLFEDKRNCVVIIEMIGGNPETVKVFGNLKSANNYIINSIHQYYIQHESKDDYSCKDIFDPEELIEFWNERHAEDGDETYYEYVRIQDNVELLPELEIRMKANKYNLCYINSK